METQPKKKRGLLFWLVVGSLSLLGLCMFFTIVGALLSPSDDAAAPAVDEQSSEGDQEPQPQTDVPSPEPAFTETPSPTSTPEPTPTLELGTADNPFPFDTVLQARTGFLGLGNTAQITLLETLRGQPAWDLIVRANSFNDQAPEGFEWILIKIHVENPGDSEETVEISPGQFAMRSGGRLFEYWDVAMDVCCLDNIGLEELESTELFGGGTVTGWLYFPVAVDDDTPLLKIGDSYVSLTP